MRASAAGRKVGAAVPLFMGEVGPHLTQWRLGQGVPPYQVVSWSIQPFASRDWKVHCAGYDNIYLPATGRQIKQKYYTGKSHEKKAERKRRTQTVRRLKVFEQSINYKSGMLRKFVMHVLQE